MPASLVGLPRPCPPASSSSPATTSGSAVLPKRLRSSRRTWSCSSCRPGTAFPSTAFRRIQRSSAAASGRSALAAVPAGPRVVLTTIAAALQRLPPREVVGRARRHCRRAPGVRSLLAHFDARLRPRRDVTEAGDYAVRGGIIDVFPPRSRRTLANRSLRRRDREPPHLRSDDAAIPRPDRRSRADAGQRGSSRRRRIRRFRAGFRAPGAAGSPRTRSTPRSPQAAAMPAWSIGCRCSTSGWKRCSRTCRRRR